MLSHPGEEQEKPQLEQQHYIEKTMEVKPPVFIETETLNDLARLVCALERVPLPLFSISTGKGTMFATQLDLFMGIPVFYFALSDQFSHFLGYKTTQNAEVVSLVDSPSNSSLIHSPIIEVVKLPKVFETGLANASHDKAHRNKVHKSERFLSMQVKDLVSLVKVASYKVLFDEPPMPIFAFPDPLGKKWLIGTFARTEDFEEASIFFYCENGSRPEQNFIRYSIGKADAMFTNRTDEHGYVYMKIIKLKESHPLIDY